MIRGLVFDLDDTLAYERDYVRSGFSAVAGRAGTTMAEVDSLDRWLHAAFESGVRDDTFDRLLRAFPDVAARMTVDDMVAIYRSHAPQVDLVPGMAATLDALQGRGLRLGVLTDGPEASQSAKVRALDLGRWFDPVVLTDRLGPGLGKPAVAGFEQIAGAWRLAGPSVAYVGDNPTKDFGGPNRLGWTTIRLRDPVQLRATLEPRTDADRARFEVTTPAALLDLLG